MTSSPEKQSSPGSKKQKSSGNKEKISSKFYCDTCDVHCPNESTLQQHNSGKKHLGNVANVQRRDKHAMCSIFVGNLPKLAQIQAKLAETGGETSHSSGKEIDKLKCDIQSVFGGYGEISKIIIDKKHGSYCIIEYQTPAMAQIALTEYQAGRIKPFYDRKLQVKSRNLTEIKPLHNIVTHNEIDAANVIALLEEADDDPVCALNMVDAAISVPDSVKRKHGEACQRIQTQLNDNLPFHNIKLSLYGSSATGLSLRDSDLDVSLSVDREKRVEREDLIGVLKQNCTGVSHVHMIPAPGQGTITRFLDGISNTMFDVLFSNRLGLANTAFISTVLSYDTRLPRLIRLIVHWNKTVLGLRFSKQAMPSSYAVTMMILHCLRQKEIIPDFLDTTLVTEHKRIYDLDCSYVSDISKLPAPTDPTSIPELISCFWKYYGSEFNRDDHVVSLRGTLKKADLEGEMSESDSQHNYVTSFKPATLSVQDPFVLTHNLTHNVSLECAVAFRDLCRSAAGNWDKRIPLHQWWLGKVPSSGGGKAPSVDINMDDTSFNEGAEAVDEGSSSIAEDMVDEGNKTPVWKQDEGPVTGSKRSVEAMEH